jgi:ADP-heptose:LPS heptosyltransferase
VTSPQGYELLRDEFDEFVILENKGFFSMASLLFRLKKTGIGKLVDLQNNDRSRVMQMIFDTTYTNKNVELRQSVTDIFYDIASGSGLVGPMDNRFRKRRSDYIVLNAGSSPKWISKRPPSNVWKNISEILYERFGMKFVLTGDAAERPVLEELSGQLVGPVENLAGKTSIQGLKDILKNAYMTVSTDSASMHISASCGTPTIGIFGATNWIRSAPYGPWSTVLYDRSVYPEGVPPTKSIQEPGDYYSNLDFSRALEKIKDFL